MAQMKNRHAVSYQKLNFWLVHRYEFGAPISIYEQVLTTDEPAHSKSYVARDMKIGGNISISYEVGKDSEMIFPNLKGLFKV